MSYGHDNCPYPGYPCICEMSETKDEKMKGLRAWIMNIETLPYVLSTMRNTDSFMEAENVLPAGGNKVLLLFKGGYPFLETRMQEAKPDIKTDDERWGG